MPSIDRGFVVARAQGLVQVSAFTGRQQVPDNSTVPVDIVEEIHRLPKHQLNCGINGLWFRFGVAA